MSRWPFLPLAAIPLVLGFLRPAPSPALVWWTTNSLEKIRPYDRVPEHAPQSVKIQAARNEFEPFQVVLRAESPAIDAVDIEVTDLRGKSGVIPSAKYISAYLVRYLNLKTPSSVTGGTGEWPDPLVPRVDRYANERRNAFPFKLTAGQPTDLDRRVRSAVHACRPLQRAREHYDGRQTSSKYSAGPRGLEFPVAQHFQSRHDVWVQRKLCRARAL